MTTPDPFCPLCDVHLDLHPHRDSTREDCDAAKRRADSLERLDRVFIPGVRDR